MNKKLIVFLFLLLAASNTWSQKINAGLKADVTFFRVNGDGMSNQFHEGVSGGFFVNFKLNNRWSVQPELLYAQRNTKAKDFAKYFSSSTSLSASNDVFLSYVSLPVVIKYQLPHSIAIHAGIQYNYLVYADENLLKDGKDAFKKNDIGAVAGVEIAASKRLGFYGRFYYGFNDINNVNDFHNWNVQQFNIGATFSLFKK